MSKTLNESMSDFIVFLNDNIDPLAKARDSITVAMDDINDSAIDELIEEIHVQKLITWDDEGINTDKLEMWLKDMYRLESK